MVKRVQERTRHRDDTRIVGEVHSAQDWAYTRIYNSEGGPDLLMTFDTELTLAARTRDYDLGANITGTLYGIKQLWVKLPSDSTFTPMLQRDAASDQQFVIADQYPSSDTTTVANGHPVRYDMVNMSKVRFAPPLPSGSILRVDAWLRPPDIDPTTNPTLLYSADIPQPAHEAIVDKATAQIFELLDDDRWKDWNVNAERRLYDAMYLMTRRSQGPVATQPFRIRRRRWI